MGLVAWREYLFVFKQSKLFVFYGTDTDSSGDPVFRYRTVDTGIGAVASRAIVAGRDGVYFLNGRGVYRTTGGVPELVSPALDPFFVGGTSEFFRSDALNLAQIGSAAMGAHHEQIFVAVPTGASTVNNRLLVFDVIGGWWTLHDMPASCLTSFDTGSREDLMFGLASGGNHVARHAASLLTDDGAPIVARWSSGWFDYKDTVVKSVRQLEVWGKGRVLVGLNRDYITSGASRIVDFAAGTDTWGDGTDGQTWGNGTDGQTWGSGYVLTPRLVRGVGVRGTVFSVVLNSTDGSPWGVYRLAAHIRSRRSVSVVSVDR